MKNLLKITLLSFGLIFALGFAVFAEDSASSLSEVTQAINLDENIQPKDLDVKEPKILPGNSFYFVKDLGRSIQSLLTFNPVAEAELRLKFANERLMEMKKLAEKPEVLIKALNEYKIETDKLKMAADEIKMTVDDPKASKFLDKFVDNIIKHEKLLGKFEKEMPPEVYEKIENANKETMAKFSDVSLKLASSSVLQEKIVENLQAQSGSDFKYFKNLEVLQTVEERVPEPAKPAIRQAMENSMKRLKEDLEKMPTESREKFQSYAENIGGNETRHLQIIDEFEREELSQIVREEVGKAKVKVLERVETRLKEYSGKQLGGAQKEFLSHLTENGGMEKLRTIKEMENNLSLAVIAPILETRQEAEKKAVEAIGNAETPEQQKVFFEQIENKFHDVKQLEVLNGIGDMIPAEKKDFYNKLIERALEKMKDEVVTGMTVSTEEGNIIIQKLAGDSPEHIKVIVKLVPPSKVAESMIKETAENISQKIESADDPAKIEIMKMKIAEEGTQKQIEKTQPQIAEQLKEKRETLGGSVTPEMVKLQIQRAKSGIEELERAFPAFLPEIQAELEKSNYRALFEAAKKHLANAERAFREGNFGEAFGQSNASVYNLSNAQEARSKVLMQNGMLEERNQKWTEFIKEVKAKFPEAIPGGFGPTDSKLTLSVHILLGCSVPPIPSVDTCKGKWQIKQDSNGCLYFACVGEAKELPCAGEEQKVSRDPSMGLTNQQCCAGLREIKISSSYSICRKEVVGVECNVDVDCPQPLCSQKSSKCYEGKCFIPPCLQEVVRPRIPPTPTPTPTGTPCPQAARLEELIPAAGPEGVCKKFISVCNIPPDWKRVDACPEPVFAPDMVGCCLEGAKTCIQAPKEKCLAEGGQAVSAWSCNIADVCFYLAAIPKAITAPVLSPKEIPSDLIACCMNYSCNLATKEVCAQSAGREIGPASECDTTYICGQVGCCFQGGICKPMIQKDCLTAGGKPYRSSCSPNQCPISFPPAIPISFPPATPIPTLVPTPIEPMIGCCLEGGLCMYETKEHCALKKGKQVSSCSRDLCPTPIPTPTPTPYYISCKEGNMKDHRCSDGTMVSWQCQCLNVKPDATAYSLWTCELAPTKFCGTSNQLALTRMEIRHYFNSMQFFWETNKPTISYMEYGPTTSYGFRAGGLSGSSGSLDTPGTLFVVEGQRLSIGTTDDSKLRRDTLYHFRIIAKDAQGNTFISDDYTFSTVPECLAGTVRNYQCSNGTLVDWCKCASEKKWDCISSPENACPISVAPQPIATECKVGETKQYKCSDGTLIDNCKCVIPEGKWDCLPSPEKSCPVPAITAVPTATLAPTAITECRTAEIKYYKCSDGTSVTSCKCTLEGKWDCLASPETACPVKPTATVTPLPVGVECKSGETKDYICPDGTRISPWCDCPDWTNGKWNCDLQMWAIAWASGSLKDPESAAAKICPAPDDVTPPVISNIEILNTSPTLINITHDTDEPAYSWLEYGITTSYGYKIEPYAKYLKISQHTPGGAVNLQPNTTYHFRVVAKDLKGNIGYSDDYTFTTGL